MNVDPMESADQKGIICAYLCVGNLRCVSGWAGTDSMDYSREVFLEIL